MRRCFATVMAATVVCACAPAAGQAQTAAAPLRAPRTILAVGAHAGDMELTTGMLLLKQHDLGDRIVLLHMTLGEGGNPKMSPEKYAEQKRREALAAAKALGAEVIFGPYKDGQVPNDDAARRYVADIIRQVRPDYVLTHWKAGIHQDHERTSAIVSDAILLAALPGVETGPPAFSGVRGVWYAENWEDPTGYQPYIYVDVSGVLPRWREAVSQYEFIRGGISSFPYLDYYTALATVRGAEGHFAQAETFDINPFGKRRVLKELP